VLDGTVYWQDIEMKVATLFLKGESRIAAIEYALKVSLVAFAAIGAFALIGIDINTFIPKF
jgi:Flp pilus assembly pilin Flp